MTMKKFTALIFIPCAIAMTAGCRSPKNQMPVDGIRQIETIEMTAARVRGEKYTPPERTKKPTPPEPAVSDVSEDLLPPDPGVMAGPELDAEGDWVEGELPGLPEPIPSTQGVESQMGQMDTFGGGAELTEEVIGEWRTVGGAALPSVSPASTGYTPSTPSSPPTPANYSPPELNANPASASARAAKARAAAKARLEEQARNMSARPSAPARAKGGGASVSTAPETEVSPADYPAGEQPDFSPPSQPFQPSFIPIPAFGTDVETERQFGVPAGNPDVSVGVPDVSVGKAAGISETVMVGRRPVTLNFVNGEWVGPQGETYSQLPIVGELLPRYGN